MSDIRCRESSTGEFESRGTSVEYAAFRAAVPWMKDEDALLGNLTDRELAEKLNRSLGAVRDRRKFLGKSAVGHPPQTFRTEREPCDHYAHLFATKSNQGLRVILGWSYRRMHNRRRRLAGGELRESQTDVLNPIAPPTSALAGSCRLRLWRITDEQCPMTNP